MPTVLTLDRIAPPTAVIDTRRSPVAGAPAETLVPFACLPLAAPPRDPPAVSGPVSEPVSDATVPRVLAVHDVEDALLYLLRGIDRLLQWKVDVISLSLGPAQPLPTAHPLALALQTAWESGVGVVVAAGNRGPAPDSLQPLARLPHVVAVGAVDGEGRLLESSSRGSPTGAQPGMVAPGTTVHLPGVPDFAPGTSFAAPRVAGLFVVVLRALQLLHDDFIDVSKGRWSTLTAPVRRPVVGLADTGVNPAALPDRSDLEAMTWHGGDRVQLSRPGQDRIWVETVGRGLARLGVQCSFKVTPDEVRLALAQAASPMPGHASWEVGAGLLDDLQVIEWLSHFTPSRFVALCGARALTPPQRDGLAALDAAAGSRWNDAVAQYFVTLFKHTSQQAMVRVV